MLFHGINNVLNKHQIDSHFVLVFVGNIGYSGKKAFLVLFTCQRIPIVAEIHIKRRIADNIIKLS